jgi:hypothetical protein
MLLGFASPETVDHGPKRPCISRDAAPEQLRAAGGRSGTPPTMRLDEEIDDRPHDDTSMHFHAIALVHSNA